MDKDLIQGNVSKSLIYFSIPLILGNLLQQLYNIMDTLIVGKYLGSQALAAVGSSFTLMTFLTSIILGLCMGSGVLFSMLYGAEDHDHLKVSFFVSFVAIGILSILIEIICILAINPILHFLNIPQDVYYQTYDYLIVVFSGIVFTFVFNYFSSLLRALGNSKTPLYFLAMSAIVNIVLDIVFIAYVHLGIQGAALATVIAQGISAFGLLFYVLKKEKNILPKKQHCYFDKTIFYKIQSFSLLTCLQQSIMNFGILMIQGLVNSFGVVTMSAFTVAVKIDAFAYMPVQDFGNAFSTFIAQNKGAGKYERIQEGIRKGFWLSGVFCIIISVFIFFNASGLMKIFIDSHEIEIIRQGVEYLRIEGTFYLGIGWLFLLYGYYRGMGKPGMSVILTVVSLGSRVLLSYALAPSYGTVVIWASIPIGWLLADVIGILAMKKKKGCSINGKYD